MTEANAHDDAAPDLRILTPGVTPEEAAAVIAVVQTQLESLTDETAVSAPPTIEAWSRGAGRLRPHISTGPGVWQRTYFPS